MSKNKINKSEQQHKQRLGNGWHTELLQYSCMLPLFPSISYLSSPTGEKKSEEKKGPNNPKKACLLWTIHLISYCRRGYKTVKLKWKLESAYSYSVVQSDTVIWSMVFDQNSIISLEVKFLLYVGKTLKVQKVQNEFIFKWTSSLTASRSSEPLFLKTIWTH